MDITILNNTNIHNTNPICQCNFCQEQLLKPNNRKLQIWYGSGSNGKTTLLEELIKRVGPNHTFFVSCPASKIEKQGDHRLVCLQEIDSNINWREYIKDYIYFADHFRKYIICTNVKPANHLINQYKDYVDFCEFPHRFSNSKN